MLVRHGESVANARGQFTGWRDPPLTVRGVEQARLLGAELRRAGEAFDAVFCSALQRAQATAVEIVRALGRDLVPVCDWRLNERHCGAFQGLAKDECKRRFGVDVVRAFRRDWHAPPPPAAKGSRDDPRTDARYRGLAAPPLGESLAGLADRVDAVWRERLLPALLAGRRVLVVGHAISLRAIERRLLAGSLRTAAAGPLGALDPRLPERLLGNCEYLAWRFPPPDGVPVSGCAI